VNAFFAVTLSRVMRTAGPIPPVAQADVPVLYSAAVGGFVAGDVGPLQTFGEINNCDLGVFRY